MEDARTKSLFRRIMAVGNSDFLEIALELGGQAEAYEDEQDARAFWIGAAAALRGFCLRKARVACTMCRGEGTYTYGSGSTWRGGAGTCSFEVDTCDVCWGTGRSDDIGTDLRVVRAHIREAREGATLQVLAKDLGLNFATMRKALPQISEKLRKARWKAGDFWTATSAGTLADILEGMAKTQEELAPLRSPKANKAARETDTRKDFYVEAESWLKGSHIAAHSAREAAVKAYYQKAHQAGLQAGQQLSLSVVEVENYPYPPPVHFTVTVRDDLGLEVTSKQDQTPRRFWVRAGGWLPSQSRPARAANPEAAALSFLMEHFAQEGEQQRQPGARFEVAVMPRDDVHPTESEEYITVLVEADRSLTVEAC